jgi:hypothetical protein
MRWGPEVTHTLDGRVAKILLRRRTRKTTARKKEERGGGLLRTFIYKLTYYCNENKHKNLSH